MYSPPSPVQLSVFASVIGLISIICLIRWRELNIRKRDFGSMCQLIGEFRDNIHNTAYHTWSPNKFEPLLNETIGAIVTGFKGHGLAGQAQGNKIEGESHRGDYKSRIRLLIEKIGLDDRWEKKYLDNLGKESPSKKDRENAEKHADKKIRRFEIITRRIPILGVWFARNVDCKAEDRVFPGVDYVLQGTTHQIDGTQCIQLDLQSAPPNIQEQWSFHRILAAIQGDDLSIQQIERRGDRWYGMDNFGITSKPPYYRVGNDGIRTWLGRVRSGYLWSDPQPWKHVLDTEHTCTLTRLVQLVNEIGSTTIDLRDHDIFSIKANGRIPDGTILDITVYHATDGAVQKIEEAGGTVNILGWEQWSDEQHFDPILPIGHYIKMKNDINVDEGDQFNFRMQDEDGHVRFEETLETVEEMLRHGILYITHHRDILGRYCISILMVKPTYSERKKIIETIRQSRTDKDGNVKTGVFYTNTYLWKDNDRTQYYEGTYGLQNYGAMLLAHAVRNGDGDFEILHWSPNAKRKNDLRKPKIRNLLTGLHEGVSEAPIYPRGYDLTYSDDEMRIERAQWFYENCILGFYRNWWDYAEKTNTTKNIGFGSLAEEMVRLYFGFRGSRTETAGDAYELQDGEWVSNEVKAISGSKGDYMGNKHPRGNMQLGENIEKVQSWNGLFYVRTEDQCQQIDGGTRGNLKMALMAPNQQTMDDLHRRILGFYTRNPTSPGKLQYDGPTEENAFDLDHVVGKASSNELLHFVRCVEFTEHPEDGQSTMNILNVRPNMRNCTCDICELGGLRWVPEEGNLSKTAWRNIRMIACNAEFWNL